MLEVSKVKPAASGRRNGRVQEDERLCVFGDREGVAKRGSSCFWKEELHVRPTCWGVGIPCDEYDFSYLGGRGRARMLQGTGLPFE